MLFGGLRTCDSLPVLWSLSVPPRLVSGNLSEPVTYHNMTAHHILTLSHYELESLQTQQGPVIV